MTRALLIALTLTACGTTSLEPPPDETSELVCGWHHVGQVVAPDEEGTTCWEAYAGFHRGEGILVELRGTDECWAVGCDERACSGLPYLRPGAVLDVWADEMDASDIVFAGANPEFCQ
jgi:hypothetical protein